MKVQIISHNITRTVRSVRVALFCLASLTTCIGGLDQLLPDEPPVWMGATFDYVSWGLPETPLLQGVLKITSVESTTFAGTWEIHWGPGADTSTFVGPQVGTGTLKGVFADGRVGVDLTRGDSSGSVRLLAVPDELGWHGRWGYFPAAGPRTGGAFTATLRP